MGVPPNHSEFDRFSIETKGDLGFLHFKKLKKVMFDKNSHFFGLIAEVSHTICGMSGRKEDQKL